MFRPPCAARTSSSPCSASPWRRPRSAVLVFDAAPRRGIAARRRSLGRPSVEFDLPPQRRRPARPRGRRQGRGENFRLAPAPLRRRTAARRGQPPLQPQPRARLRRAGEAAAKPKRARSARAAWSAPPSTIPNTPGPTACSATGSAPAAATRRRRGPRSSTAACAPASTASSSPSPPTTARRRPYHDVTNFQILEKPGHEIADCVGGKVSSAEAAAEAAFDEMPPFLGRRVSAPLAGIRFRCSLTLRWLSSQYFTLYSQVGCGPTAA